MSNLTKQANNTKIRIIEIARQLFSEYSYSGVSMNDIAKQLNITKAALYYHFSGKIEIYKKTLDKVFDNLNKFIVESSNEKSVNKKMDKFIKNYLDFGFKEKNFIKVLIFKPSSGNPQLKKHTIKLKEKLNSLIQPLVKELIKSKKREQKIDSKLLTSFLVGTLNGLILEYSFFNKKINSEKISNQIITTLF